jgi:formylglycine-generating enzyme required for sulfatase activity
MEHNAPAAAPQASSAEPGVAAAPASSAPLSITVPGTTAVLVMQPVPEGAIDMPAVDGAAAPEHVQVAAFSIATTETTWDMYDAFVFALDRGANEVDPPDAWARPSKPYILMDRGFGHAGYPAISVSFRGASEFCRWLSAKTQRRFRLPTEAEWRRANDLGADTATSIGERAWCAENSEVEMRLSTHPVAQMHSDGLGLFDLLGNAAEWTTGPNGTGIAHGGSFKDHAEVLTSSVRRADDRALNATDPQIPKSKWWLADGGFVGFRVVMESSSTGAGVAGESQRGAGPLR